MGLSSLAGVRLIRFLMYGKKRWRVRVSRKIEDWVECQADTAQEAELLASAFPGIVHVFPGSTISAEKPVGTVVPIGAQDD